MNTGNETWKWGVVVILLAIFMITAHHAYQHIANQEEFAPPEPTPDSWDLEHSTGPGAGQPKEFSSSQGNKFDDSAPKVKVNQRLSMPKTIILDDNSEWNKPGNSSGSSEQKEIINKTEGEKAEPVSDSKTQTEKEKQSESVSTPAQ